MSDYNIETVDRVASVLYERFGRHETGREWESLIRGGHLRFEFESAARAALDCVPADHGPDRADEEGDE